MEKKNRPWYQKGWDMASDFVGEASGYYDGIRATTGVDPLTGSL
ncbi:pre-toxin TG domain-containing protein [Metabacillus sp. RGM 3146]